MAPPSMDYWLGFFRGAGDNIFDAIDAAITVAASDHPTALRARRDAIAERLYTALLVSGAPAAAVHPPAGGPATEAPPAQLLPEGAASVPSLCSSDRAEAITDDGARRRDDPVAAEAERIKADLLNNQEKSEAALLELLRRLQQLEFTVDTLTVTEIGKAVSSLRKHNSRQIRQLVRLLIEGWKRIVDEWMSSRDAAIVDHTPQSMHPSSLEQEDRGLSSPSMDEGALFATPTTSIRLSEENPDSNFFDGTDDDGNIRNNGGKDGGRRYPMSQEPVRKPPPMGQRYDPEQSWRQEQSAARQSGPQELSNGKTRGQFVAAMLARPSNADSGPGRPKQHQDASLAQRRPQSTPSDKPVSHHDENSVRAKLELARNAKLELAKRKLQEGYQEYDNAKKQRTIQMVDPQDIPKQGNQNWQPDAKPRNSSNINNCRNWSR
uniref:Transcription elongation factor (TEF) n=1 Tax=Dendrocalamus latiflorus TaxID=257763 RepID=U5S5Z0_DENLA|nr:Transcription elongation factor (TEF) [Dendrocalamus latiflorus]